MSDEHQPGQPHRRIGRRHDQPSAPRATMVVPDERVIGVERHDDIDPREESFAELQVAALFG
ncbi:MAG TPA: hypothetical protein VME70_02015, partial [Mycobacteriales bacterium]|nr:hypothetical protein [Mycobacteriales bacterium]